MPTATTDILNATVIQRNDLTAELSIVRVQPDSGQITPFKPGQFCTIGLPRPEPTPDEAAKLAPPPPGPRLFKRPYSIASSADVHDYYELYIVLVEEGRLTPRIWTVPQGGKVWLDHRIEGKFTLDDVPTDKDLVMIATGTGMAPFLSMLRTYRGRGEKRWRRFVMIHGTRLACDLGYCNELQAISRQDPSVIFLPIVTREPEDSAWQGLRGRIHTILETESYQRLVGAPLCPEESYVFLCGNPAMIKEAAANLESRGFVAMTKTTPGNLHYERYW